MNLGPALVLTEQRIKNFLQFTLSRKEAERLQEIKFPASLVILNGQQSTKTAAGSHQNEKSEGTPFPEPDEGTK